MDQPVSEASRIALMKMAVELASKKSSSPTQEEVAEIYDALYRKFYGPVSLGYGGSFEIHQDPEKGLYLYLKPLKGP